MKGHVVVKSGSRNCTYLRIHPVAIRETSVMNGIIGINDTIAIREANTMTGIRGMTAIHVGMGADPVIMRKRIGE
jgi:hypothetical protein